MKDAEKTIEVLQRTGYSEIVKQSHQILRDELGYLHKWLDKWAPEDIKFELAKDVKTSNFNDTQKKFLQTLARKITTAPAGADGDWFHKAIYDLEDEIGMEPKAMFETLYKALIGKSSGPRAGWFLQVLPREWLIKRLRLEA